MTDIVVMSAVILTRVGGVALTLAIAGAMVEAMWPGAQDAMATRVWGWLVSTIRMALRLIYLLTCGWAILAYRLAVTYLHTPGRTGRHHYSRIRARRDGGIRRQGTTHRGVWV